MTLREITIDNSVKYIHSANSPPCGTSHDHKPKIASLPRKQNEKLSRNKKSSSKFKQ